MSLWLQGFLLGMLVATVVIVGIAAGIGGAVLRARASPTPKSPPRQECVRCLGTGTLAVLRPGRGGREITTEEPCPNCGGTGEL